MSWDSQRTGYTDKQPKRGILRSALKKTSRPHPNYRVPKQFIPKEEEDNEELLVFGYACKIFPPDDHSKNIARLRHLIPWNGDENLQLMIDRYDGRASLHDLSEFDGDSWNVQYETSEEDARIEQLCDQERYMALYTDLAEEKIRHEEELKRLHASIAGEETSSFKEVGFNYDSQQQQPPPPADVQQQNVTNEQIEDEHEEKPFMAPTALAVPSDMEIPPTEKMHAIIEKTANFVSTQGAQMEIVLKAKQANNSQFLFLNYDHYLNPYYKNMVKRIKEGKYRVGMKDEEKKEEIQEEESESDSDDEGGYLHPSLFASSSAANKKREEENKEKFKAIQKVDPNHPLAKLIEKGRKANALKQYTMMKNAVQNYNPGIEDALEPPPLPQFLENADSRSSSTTSSPITTQDHDTIQHSMTPQEAAMVIVPPPPDIQPMVDSVAKQIAEEGDSVEMRLKSQNDPMLAFLLPSHELHPYYTFRKTYIREQLKAQQRLLLQQQQQEAALKKAAEANEATTQAKSAPISFSIKTKKESSTKPTIIQNRLQQLGDDDDEEEEGNEERGNDENNKETKEENENKENENEHKTEDTETKSVIAKRKFVEEVDNSAPTESRDTVSTESIVSGKRPRRKFTLTPQPLPSNFTVVTPTGEKVSIAEFREKQAERRQKASMFLQKNTEDSDEQPAVLSTEKKPNDIFDIFEDGESGVNSTTTTTTATTRTTTSTIAEKDEKELEIAQDTKDAGEPLVRISPAKSKSPSPARSSSIERKSSPALQPTTVPTTLKDLIAAASRSSTPSYKEKKSKRHRSRSRSRSKSKSKSRSRHSSPRDYSGKRWSRSRSRDRDYLPSSYRKILGSSKEESSCRSSKQRSRYKDQDENVPSAYKIENPQPSSYNNGSYSKRDRETSPYYRSRKRYRHDSDKEESKKKHRSRKSPSHKSSKKKKSSLKSKKKHKKKKSKSKKKKEKETSSEEGEYGSNSDDENDSSDDSDNNISKVFVVNTKPIIDKEEGELSPQQDKELSNVQETS